MKDIDLGRTINTLANVGVIAVIEDIYMLLEGWAEVMHREPAMQRAGNSFSDNQFRPDFVRVMNERVLARQSR